MGFLTLKANGNITNSLRFKEVDNNNVLKCLTESVHSIDENFSLHSLYLMFKRYPILLNVLDTPDRYSPYPIYPVSNFLSFFRQYSGEYIEPNFIETAYINQIVALSKSNYHYRLGDLDGINSYSKIEPEKLHHGHNYLFENQYELSLHKNNEMPSPDNDFYRTGIPQSVIDNMSHMKPLRVKLGNILFFYSESKLELKEPVNIQYISLSAENVIKIKLIDFLETILSNTLCLRENKTIDR